MDKDIVFYSNYCKYSQDLINYIVKKDLKKMFVFVSVDINRNRIPPLVDRVPALFLVKERKVLFDDDILACIEASVPDANPLENLSSAFAENYSFLGDEQESKPAGGGFATFGKEQRIYCPKEDDGGKGPDNEATLERYNHTRESDLQKIFGDKKRV
jgi:hypothetical protein